MRRDTNEPEALEKNRREKKKKGKNTKM